MILLSTTVGAEIPAWYSMFDAAMIGILGWICLQAIQAETIKVGLNLDLRFVDVLFPVVVTPYTVLWWRVSLGQVAPVEFLQSSEDIRNAVLVDGITEGANLDSVKFLEVAENCMALAVIRIFTEC
jgi:hypothetical protein